MAEQRLPQGCSEAKVIGEVLLHAGFGGFAFSSMLGSLHGC